MKKEADSQQFQSQMVFNAEEQKILIEQWKKMIDIADSNSERRIKTNNLYLTLNTLIIAGTNILSEIPIEILSTVGMLISILWFFSILNYRTTNKYRYEIIRNLEEKMQNRPISDEYNSLPKVPIYLGNTIIEFIIPVVFSIAYFTLIILNQTALK